MSSKAAPGGGTARNTSPNYGLKFTAGVSRYPNGQIAELFLDNHKAGSAIGTLVRDMAIAFSFAVQHGADPEEIRKALCRDSEGRPLGPLAAALDLIASTESENAKRI